MDETEKLLRCAHKENQKALKRLQRAFKELGRASEQLENSTIARLVTHRQKPHSLARCLTVYAEAALKLF